MVMHDKKFFIKAQISVLIFEGVFKQFLTADSLPSGIKHCQLFL
jgi:hypothetical protein